MRWAVSFSAPRTSARRELQPTKAAAVRGVCYSKRQAAAALARCSGLQLLWRAGCSCFGARQQHQRAASARAASARCQGAWVRLLRQIQPAEAAAARCSSTAARCSSFSGLPHAAAGEVGGSSALGEAYGTLRVVHLRLSQHQYPLLSCDTRLTSPWASSVSVMVANTPSPRLLLFLFL